MDNKKIMTIALIAVIIVGVGAFYGGTIYEKNSLTAQGLLRTASGVRGQLGQAAAGGQQGQGRAAGPGMVGRGANGGNFAIGQIISQDNTSITIKTQDGSSKIVFFSGSTQIGKLAQGSSSDLSVGEQVMINGQSNADGSIAAQNIQIRPDQTQPAGAQQSQPAGQQPQ